MKFVGILLGLLVSFQPASALEVGDQAPDFELPGSDGKTYRLSDFLGEEAVVLAWFPRAFTSGCTIECKSLAKNGKQLRRFAMRYFMVSVDPLDENKRFARAESADFPILSDETKEIARAYGVLHQNRFALRHTFYIGKDGKILAIDRNVAPETSAEDMISQLAELEIPRGTP